MNTEVMFSSKNSCWETPQDLFDQLDAKFHFETDVCALPENAKCKKFFTPEQDGLAQKWSGVCWCNPPYGKGIERWLKKAYESTDTATTVCLVPVRTDTAWFHDWVLNKAEIWYLRGRLHFGGSKNSAPFPSMVLVYRSKWEF